MGHTEPTRLEYWGVIGGMFHVNASMELTSCFEHNKVALRMNVLSSYLLSDAGNRIYNSGYWGMVYDFQRPANPNLSTQPPTLPSVPSTIGVMSESGNSLYNLPNYMTNQELENQYIDMTRFNNMGIQEQGGLPFAYAHASGSTMQMNAGTVSESGRRGGTNKSPISLNNRSKPKSKTKGKPSNHGRYFSGSSNSRSSGHDHMDVIDSMVASCHLEPASKLWCFVVSIIRKSSARIALTRLRTNHLRKVWLEFEYSEQFPKDPSDADDDDEEDEEADDDDESDE